MVKLSECTMMVDRLEPLAQDGRADLPNHYLEYSHANGKGLAVVVRPAELIEVPAPTGELSRYKVIDLRVLCEQGLRATLAILNTGQENVEDEKAQLTIDAVVPPIVITGSLIRLRSGSDDEPGPEQLTFVQGQLPPALKADCLIF